ncbi:hypothetical protein ABL78_2584 [Leptomonas seymouri]|uniref:DNL-type domain-containing protein n=1 Tax=Leptomonas seymouri TaxID=5684 RepID=A0A0N1I0Q0_LEPSE|nr:hypothetical protein ABL78_2584 [Leptomonas seymouri]|eukprot:KPI88345.1 hypothetical protein ABL78_2584 [Leptomonas seymouri]
MLRRAVKLSLSASPTALRHYATPAKLAPCAAAASSLVRVAPLRTVGRTLLISTPSHVMTVASCCTVAPRRWSSSNSEMKANADAASAQATNASAAEETATPPPPENLSVGESSNPNPSPAEQAGTLSAEDVERIILALRQPEKEKSSVMGGAGIGPAGGDMVAAFTCGPCDYRMVKRFSKHAYTKGIVIVECPNCHVKHLLADNLGWLEDEAKNIEDFLREKGESFTRIDGTSGDFQAVVDDGADAASAGPSLAAGAEVPPPREAP